MPVVAGSTMSFIGNRNHVQNYTLGNQDSPGVTTAPDCRYQQLLIVVAALQADKTLSTSKWTLFVKTENVSAGGGYIAIENLKPERNRAT